MIFFGRKKNREKTDEKPKTFRRSAFHIGVNIFVGIFEVLIVLILLAIGFMQTSTFRNYLREKVVEEVNKKINGEFYLEEIDGTILTTIELKKFGIIENGDTTLSVDEFRSSLALFPLLGKKILLREITLVNPKAKFLEIEKGKWTIADVFKKNGKTREDTVKKARASEKESSFPFVFELADFGIENGEFVYKDFNHVGADSVYRHVHFSDLKISGINFRLNAIADLSKKDFYIGIKELSFDDNLNPFQLKKLTALIHLTKDYTELKKFSLETEKSDILCSARLDGFSLFGKTKLTRDLPAKAELKIKSFDFADLNTFLPSLDFLHGDIEGGLIVDGKYGDLKIRNLDLALENTELNLKGSLKNLHRAKDLYIDANIKGNVDYDEVERLLAGLHLPKFDGLSVKNVKIAYSGLPLKFHTTVSAQIDTAEIEAKAFMDLRNGKKIYDYEINTTALNLEPVIRTKTFLNLSARIKGDGFSPAEMTNEAEISLKNSKFDGYAVSDFRYKSQSGKGKTNLRMSGNVQDAFFSLGGFINLKRGDESFDLKGKIEKLDLAKLLRDSRMKSDINLDFLASAENVYSPNVSADIEVDFHSTRFRGSDELSDKKIALSVWGDSVTRHIDLKSALVDAEVFGNFDYHDLPQLLARQGARIAATINDNVLSKATNTATAVPEPNAENFGESDISYNIVFNETDIWAKILDIEALTLSGYSYGSISNTKRSFIFKNNTYISNFIYIKNDKIYYVNNTNFKAFAKNSNFVNSIDSLTFSAGLRGDKIFFGKNLTDFDINTAINGNNIYLQTSAVFDSIYALNSSGEISISEKTDSLSFDKFEVRSNAVLWKNKIPVKIRLSEGQIFFDKFELFCDSARFRIDGKLAVNNDFSELNAEFIGLPLNKIDKMLLNKSLGFEGFVNLKTSLKGGLSAPHLRAEMRCVNFSYENAPLGDVILDAEYVNSETNLSLKMIGRKILRNELVFSLNGVVRKSLFGENTATESLDLKFTANDFKLAAFSPLIEDVSNIKGKLNADIEVKGKIGSPEFDGFAELSNGRFYVTANGLDYLLNAKMLFNDKTLSIENLTLMNDPATGFKGKINLRGKISLDDYKFNVENLELDGGLGLLSEKTKFINPYFYGNLYVETGGKWKFSYVDGKAFLHGSLKITDADITITSTSGTESVDLSNIEYVYVTDSTKIEENRAQLLLQKYISAQFKENDEETEHKSLFDYDLTFDIVNRATLNFVFSKVANQKLKAITNGSITLSSIDGEKAVQGEFHLLPGSRLDFFRTFEATGVIRFERDLLNPYLDITAVYKGVHYKSVQTEGISEEQVAVKIKLQGLLKNLGKNLTSKKSNIAVYVGKKNIDNNIPDPKLDASDAMSFILIGKFNNDLTSAEQYKFSNELTSTTTAMLGTVMGAFLNSAMGDLVNDVDISKTQSRTKITLKGRLGRFYYSIGGSQTVFQDLAQANWKVEYFFNKNLSFRVERREPLTGYLNNSQMTDEIGIKYKVSF